jgi:hypothetical protein
VKHHWEQLRLLCAIVVNLLTNLLLLLLPHPVVRLIAKM